MTHAVEPARTTRTGTAGWSAADEQFFRIVAEAFRPAFLQGASVLLSSYDPPSAVAEDPE